MVNEVPYIGHLSLLLFIAGPVKRYRVVNEVPYIGHLSLSLFIAGPVKGQGGERSAVYRSLIIVVVHCRAC